MRTAAYGPQKTQSLKIKREKKASARPWRTVEFPFDISGIVELCIRGENFHRKKNSSFGLEDEVWSELEWSSGKGNEKKRQTKLSMEVIIIEEKTSEGERMSVPQKSPENII